MRSNNEELQIFDHLFVPAVGTPGGIFDHELVGVQAGVEFSGTSSAPSDA
jgi:hypothetical protein